MQHDNGKWVSDYVNSIKSKMLKSELFEMQFVNFLSLKKLMPRMCKPFLFPFKPRCGFADFNKESIVRWPTQCVTWQFCCIIIKM